MASSTALHEYLQNYVVGEQNSAVDDVASVISSREATLLDLVDLLGPSLTSTEVHTRCRGTRLLAEVLNQLRPSSLSCKETEVLLAFFCHRVEDHHSVTPHVLHGMKALSVLPALSIQGSCLLVQSIFKEVHVQSLAHTDRLCVYEIVIYLLNNRIEDLLPLGADFVYGFVQAMDGEKNPRNLDMTFKIVPIIAQRFPLGVFCEELFEVVACYFPIDFNPSPSDPQAVTKEQLILGLRQCLCASPKFAEFCLPLLLEKMTSSITSSKIDALDTLTACAEIYGAEKVDEFTGSIWSCIRKEVCEGSSEKVEMAALGALTALSRTLTNESSVENNSKRFDDLIKIIFEDCEKFLSDSDHNLMWPNCRLLQAVAIASQPACSGVVNKVVPLLLQRCQQTTKPLERKNTVEALVLFIKTAKDVDQSGACVLEPFQSSLYSSLVSLLSDKMYQLRLQAVRGLVGLLAIPDMVDKNQRPLLIEHFTSLVLSDVDASVRQECLMALTYMSSEYPDIIQEISLPRFVRELQHRRQRDGPSGDSQGDTEGRSSHVTPEYLFNCLASVSVTTRLVTEVVPVLLGHMTSLANESSEKSTLPQAQALCACLQNIVDANVPTPNCRDYFFASLLPECIKLLVCGAVRDSDNVLRHCDVIDNVCSVLRSVVQNLEDRQGTQIAPQVAALFLDSDLGFLSLADVNSSDFCPFMVTAPKEQSHLVAVLLAVMCSLSQQTTVPRLSELLSRLLELSCDCCHGYTRNAAVKCLTGLLNKIPVAELEEPLTGIRTQLEQRLQSPCDTATQYTVSSVWVWVTKALVTRNHPQQTVWIQQILDWLEVADLSQSAADGFYIILHEYPDVMTTRMHANVTLMYRQRFFVLTLAKLKEGFQATTPDKKQYYLTALSYLLRYVPKQVLTSELPSLLPLLLQSLTIPEESLWQSTLTSLYDLVYDAPDILSSHLEELLPRLLDLMKYKPKMKVRIGALQCLGALTTLPIHTLLPHKQRVVRAMVTGLDDHKRLVRKEAVMARQEWLLLDAPGS